MYKQLRKELSEDREFPLLNRSQLRFLDEVKEIVDRKVVEIAPKYMKYEDHRKNGNSIQKKILDVIYSAETYLMKIIQSFRDARKSQPGFVFAYPIWRRKRDECIAKLTEIANSINSDRFNCNVSKLVGYSASALGGGITLVSAALIPFSFGLTTPLAVAGGSLIAAGCGTAIGTSVAEITRLNKKVNEAKELIEEDKECFEDLGVWLDRASDLQEVLQAVLDIDVLKDVFDSANKFARETAQIINDRQRYNVTERCITEMLHKFLPIFIKMDVQISAVAPLITVLVAICLLLLNTNNRVVFDFASVTIRSILGIPSLIKESVDLYSLSRLVPGSAAAVAKNFSRAVTRGAVAVVGIALDVIGIVFVSKDIHAGSLSPEAKKIKDAVKKMREEADVLDNMYRIYQHRWR